VNQIVRPTVLPNDRQLPLMHAATALDRQSALSAWAQYVSSYQSQPEELTNHRILPLVYHNLAVNHRVQRFHRCEELKRLYYTIFAENHYLLNDFKPVLDVFLQHQIPVVAIKGFAHLHSLYHHLGARKMMDVDIMVPIDYFYQACELLTDLKWKTFPCQPYEQFNHRNSHALNFFNENNHNIDLHCHLIHINLNPTDDKAYWESLVPFEFAGYSIQTLCPTDHLLHVFFHAHTIASWIAPLRWIPDALNLIRQSPIDWDRIVMLSRERYITSFVSNTLGYLKKTFDVEIPDDTLKQLNETVVCRLEKAVFDVFNNVPAENLIKQQKKCYMKIRYTYRQYSSLFCLLEYLKVISKTKHLWQVPVKLPLAIFRKLCC